MARPPPRSFLLRLWRERADAPLRATLISVANAAETRHFDTLDACCAWLHGQAVAPGGPDVDLDGSAPIVAQTEAAEK